MVVRDMYSITYSFRPLLLFLGGTSPPPSPCPGAPRAPPLAPPRPAASFVGGDELGAAAGKDVTQQVRRQHPWMWWFTR